MSGVFKAQRDALDLATRLGAVRYDELSGRMLDFTDPETVWLVIEGQVDVQVVPLASGRVSGVGRHLFEAIPGHLLPGTPPQPGDAPDTSVALRGRCTAGTILYRTTRNRLRALELDLEALLAIERWVEAFAAATAPESRALSTDLIEADPD